MMSVANCDGFFPLALITLDVTAPVKTATTLFYSLYFVCRVSSVATKVLARVEFSRAGCVIADAPSRSSDIQTSIRLTIKRRFFKINQLFLADISEYRTVLRVDTVVVPYIVPTNPKRKS